MKIFLSYNKEPPNLFINLYLEDLKIVIRTLLDFLDVPVQEDFQIVEFIFSNQVYLASV